MKKSDPTSFSTLRKKALNQLILHLLYSKGHTKLPGYLSSMVVYVGIQKKVIFDQMIRFLDHFWPFKFLVKNSGSSWMVPQSIFGCHFFTHLGSFLCMLGQTGASLICLNYRPQNLAQLLPQNSQKWTFWDQNGKLCHFMQYFAWFGPDTISTHKDKTPQGLKERVHSEMKISDRIKLDPNIMPFAFFFSKSVSIPSNIISSLKMSLPGPAL